MATVFLTEDLRHHRQVAIKVLHAELTASTVASWSALWPRMAPEVEGTSW
jgi:hypothetical protein